MRSLWDSKLNFPKKTAYRPNLFKPKLGLLFRCTHACRSVWRDTIWPNRVMPNQVFAVIVVHIPNGIVLVQRSNKYLLSWTKVVAQLVERLLPTQEIRNSNPVEFYLLSTVLKRRKSIKRGGEWLIKKNNNKVVEKIILRGLYMLKRKLKVTTKGPKFSVFSNINTILLQINDKDWRWRIFYSNSRHHNIESLPITTRPGLHPQNDSTYISRRVTASE